MQGSKKNCYDKNNLNQYGKSLRKLAHAIYRRFFQKQKLKNLLENIWYFNAFAQNKECVYTLEAPCRGGSNEYTQCMFWIKNKKNRYTPANPFSLYKVGFDVVYIKWTCFPDVLS